MRIAMVIQARMGSRRLPGKVLKPVLGRPLLELLVERLRAVRGAGPLIVATSFQAADDPIADLAASLGVAVVRGSEDDPLARFLKVQRRFNLEVLVRLTADNPLIDPEVVERLVETFRGANPPLDYLSNAGEGGYPLGYIAEVVRAESLERVFAESDDPDHHEHVTAGVWSRPDRYRVDWMRWSGPVLPYRLTVDTPEDLALVAWVCENLYPRDPSFRLDDVVSLLADNPRWASSNRHVRQKGIARP